MPDFSGLSNVVESKPAKVGHRPLDPGQLASGSVLAFDQSLGSTTGGGTGWVALVGRQVVDAGTFKTSSTLKGHAMSLDRGVQVYNQASSQLMGWSGDVAIEMPPVGGRMARPESSLLAALAIKIACCEFSLPCVIVSAQRAKKTICGNSNAPKPVAHKALMQCDWIVGLHRITNESHRDALLVGLQYLIDKKGK